MFPYDDTLKFVYAKLIFAKRIPLFFLLALIGPHEQILIELEVTTETSK